MNMNEEWAYFGDVCDSALHAMPYMYTMLSLCDLSSISSPNAWYLLTMLYYYHKECLWPYIWVFMPFTAMWIGMNYSL